MSSSFPGFTVTFVRRRQVPGTLPSPYEKIPAKATRDARGHSFRGFAMPKSSRTERRG